MKIYTVISMFIVLVVYEYFSFSVGKPLILPSGESILMEIFTIIGGTTFIEIISVTVVRTLVTFVCILVLSLVVGILAGYYKVVAALLNPAMILLRTIPTVSLILILLIWFGRDLGPTIIVGLVIFPIIYELVVGSIKKVDSDLKDVCLLFGCTIFEKFFALYYPNLIYALSSGVQATLGLAFKVMVMAEVMAQSRIGIGQALNYEKTYLNMAGVFGWTIILILIVMIFDFLISMIMKFLLRKLE